MEYQNFVQREKVIKISSQVAVMTCMNIGIFEKVNTYLSEVTGF